MNILTCIGHWTIQERERQKYIETYKVIEDVPPGAYGEKQKIYFSPFSIKAIGEDDKLYIRNYSIIHSLFYNIKSLFVHKSDYSQILSLRNGFSDNQIEPSYPKTKLVICLIESFETWVFRPDIMPNLYRLSDLSNSLFCDKVISQARRGTSADGQLIIETGLLPSKEGAACFRFPNNVYPSLNYLYIDGNSCSLFPHDLSVWNQDKMCDAYGFHSNFIHICDDEDLFSKALDLSKQYECVFFITVSTHSPFMKIAKDSKIKLPEDMPASMRNYLYSFNAFDTSISNFIDKIINEPENKNTTFVFTGDHTVFQQEKREHFLNYCESNNLSYHPEFAYCPLIIVSPSIKEKTFIDKEVFQMDIYPTILDLLGVDNYCWKGFGINIMSGENKERVFDTQEALEMSDIILNTDYFQSYSSLVHPYIQQ